MACYKVGRLILLLCGKYSTSSTVSVHMRPLYSICTSIVPTYCLLSTGSRHICVHGTCIPSYVHCISASIVLVLPSIVLFLYNCTSAPHVSVAFFLKGCVIFMVGRRRKLSVCSFLFCFSSVTFLLLLFFLTGSFQNNVSDDKPVESSSHSPAPKNNEKLSSDGKKEDKPLTAGTEE